MVGNLGYHLGACHEHLLSLIYNLMTCQWLMATENLSLTTPRHTVFHSIYYCSSYSCKERSLYGWVARVENNSFHVSLFVYLHLHVCLRHVCTSHQVVALSRSFLCNARMMLLTIYPMPPSLFPLYTYTCPYTLSIYF